MNVILTNPSFYIELSLESIKLFTKNSCSIYPVWLGKNRAIMRDVVAYFQKYPPETLVDALHIVGHFGLSGQGALESPDIQYFKKPDKMLDKDRVFW